MGKRVAIGTWVRVLAGLVAGSCFLCGCRGLDHGPREEARLNIRTLANAIVYEALVPNRPPLDLPRGDVRALYRWFTEDNRPGDPRWSNLGPDTIDREGSTFRDPWGRELVYRFPAGEEDLMFELYSLGPNGVDEHGGGDDITCGPFNRFELYEDYFEGGRVDLKWIRANLGKLRRNPTTGKIIGAGDTAPGK